MVSNYLYIHIYIYIHGTLEYCLSHISKPASTSDDGQIDVEVHN